MSQSEETFMCATCGKQRPRSQRVVAERLHHAVTDRMRKDHPGWDGQFTCRPDVRRYRVALLRDAFETQRGEVKGLDEVVLRKMEQSQFLTRNLAESQPTLGERVADRVAEFGGSWPFLGLFAGVLLGWIGLNLLMLHRAFDPYPFILLNLVLSCLAAVQAPVIMMSQNRQAQKDRERAQHDYETNLKAELEVQLLHEKLDHLLLVEWQKLLDVQAIQTDMLEELAPPPSSESSPE